MHLGSSTLLAGVLLGATLIGACSSNSAPPSSTGGDDSRGFNDVPDGGFLDSPSAAEPTGDTFDGPGGSCKLTLQYGSSECSACVTDNCCAPVAACEADATCNALQTCVSDCLFVPDRMERMACFNGCKQEHPAPDRLWEPLYTCWFHGPCVEECEWKTE